MSAASPASRCDAVIQLPFGRMGLCARDGQLTSLQFLPPDQPLQAPADVLLLDAQQQLQAWCAGERTGFDLPWQAEGSPFSQRVWQVMQQIAPGATRTYGEVAAELGSSARAVGGACGRNPLPLLIPCHRIVGRSSAGGFNHSRSGWLLDIKYWLLRHEQQCYSGQLSR